MTDAYSDTSTTNNILKAKLNYVWANVPNHPVLTEINSLTLMCHLSKNSSVWPIHSIKYPDKSCAGFMIINH